MIYIYDDTLKSREPIVRRAGEVSCALSRLEVSCEESIRDAEKKRERGLIDG